MGRIILTVVGMFVCSTGFGQELSVPQNNPIQTTRASFQPPVKSRLPVDLGNPDLGNPDLGNPGPATSQNKTAKSQGASPSTQAVSLQETVAPGIPQPSFLRAKTEQQPSTELPSPSAGDQAEMTTDDEVYQSIRHNNSMGVSNYRVAVAKQRAHARRMRMEAKKWYGIDSARPAVAPRGYLPAYSAYYNGIFSRPGYQYNHGANFYFHVPIAR